MIIFSMNLKLKIFHQFVQVHVDDLLYLKMKYHTDKQLNLTHKIA